MTKQRIIGIDPGLTKTGVGVIDIIGNSLSFVFCDTIYSSPTLSMAERLSHFHKSLLQIIQLYQPNIASIEETFVNKNPISSLKLGHARGALILTLGICGIEVHEYSATSVKKTIVGVGRAEKQQIQAMIKILLPKANFKNEDEADALAIAICHHHNKRNW
ncbi:MAG: crossover junction endodeoxyribonuclease RuvC [Proteobacteria bacterium]|nr:crossover junction endodeoxyribonuclease RuvC [Pseudomonadota bacterium]NCA28690.1 crossover junction endodeoxyribonuclease RuvC [Pseudomonadota bacterium]